MIQEEPVNDDVEASDRAERAPIWIVVASALLLYGHLIVGSVFGLIAFEVVPVPASSLLQILVYSTLYGLGVDMILVRPLALYIFPQLKARGLPILRVYMILLLLMPPIFSFQYYRSGLNELGDFHELFLGSCLPVVLSAIFFERYRSRVLFSIFLALSTVLPNFIINDVMSGATVPISYLSTGNLFYLIRTFFPVLAVSFVVVLNVPWKRELDPSLCQSLACGFLGLSFYAFWVRIFSPVAVALFRAEPLKSYVQLDLWWALYLGMGFFFVKRSPMAYRLLRLSCVVSLSVICLKTLFYLRDPNLSYWGLSWFSYQLAALFLVGITLLLILRKRKDFRLLFA